MKTPRELLLEKHQATDRRLDELRRHVIWGLAHGTSRTPAPLDWRLLWASMRGHIAALAGVWLVVAFLNAGAGSSEPGTTKAAPKPTAQQVSLAVREQRRQLAELLAGESETDSARRRPASQPRSQVEGENRVSGAESGSQPKTLWKWSRDEQLC